MQADTGDSIGAEPGAVGISDKATDPNGRSETTALAGTTVRPRGGRLMLTPKAAAGDFDAAAWRRDWFRHVGSIGGRHIGKLILCFSRRLRSPERLRLLRALRQPGAVAAVFEEYCRDLAAQEARYLGRAGASA